MIIFYLFIQNISAYLSIVQWTRQPVVIYKMQCNILFCARTESRLTWILRVNPSTFPKESMCFILPEVPHLLSQCALEGGRLREKPGANMDWILKLQWIVFTGPKNPLFPFGRLKTPPLFQFLQWALLMRKMKGKPQLRLGTGFHAQSSRSFKFKIITKQWCFDYMAECFIFH